jgi:hypothetical protein
MRIFLSLAMASLAAIPMSAADCDRACMKGLLTRYLDAVVAHKPESLPLAPNVRFTEDSKDLKLGEGVWKTATKLGGYRQDYIDLKKSIAATHAVVLEADAQVQYSVLLRVVDQKITGIETLVNRITPTSRFKPDSLDNPLPGMRQAVPGGQRMPREEMIRIAMFYPEGLRIGSFVEAKTPFSKEAYRVENGLFMAGVGGPKPNSPAILTQKIITHPDVKAQTAVVDEEEGIVVLWMNFGDTNSYGPGNALITFEAFKVWGGEIQAVNAFFRTMPKETQRGWAD